VMPCHHLNSHGDCRRQSSAVSTVARASAATVPAAEPSAATQRLWPRPPLRAWAPPRCGCKAHGDPYCQEPVGRHIAIGAIRSLRGPRTADSFPYTLLRQPRLRLLVASHGSCGPDTRTCSLVGGRPSSRTAAVPEPRARLHHGLVRASVVEEGSEQEESFLV